MLGVEWMRTTIGMDGVKVKRKEGETMKDGQKVVARDLRGSAVQPRDETVSIAQVEEGVKEVLAREVFCAALTGLLANRFMEPVDAVRKAREIVREAMKDVG
jgi:hypothetical protein